MMIRIAAAYPRQKGKKFDMDYYMNIHLPKVWKKFAPFGLTKIEVDRGIEKPGGGESPFFAIGYLYFNTLAQFQECYAAVGAEVVGNIPIYTDVVPMIQVGEITLPCF
jgi:uncharacterized protein (TIGR02118 family)